MEQLSPKQQQAIDFVGDFLKKNPESSVNKARIAGGLSPSALSQAKRKLGGRYPWEKRQYKIKVKTRKRVPNMITLPVPEDYAHPDNKNALALFWGTPHTLAETMKLLGGVK